MSTLPEIPSASSRRLSILVIHPEVPRFDRQSGCLRLYRMLEGLAADGHQITLLGREGTEHDSYARALRDELGIEVHPYDARYLRSRGLMVAGPGIDMPTFLRRGKFDLAWLSFYEVAEDYLHTIRTNSPGTRIVIDSHDVHHLRERRGAELVGDPKLLAVAAWTKEREQAIYSQADAVIAVSEDDARVIRELAPGVPVTVVSNFHPSQSDLPGFDAREGIVFVGNFAHVPNIDAILDFCAGTWPLIAAELPEVRLTIVGNAPPPVVEALAGDRVTVTGWVPDTAPYLREARISVAPIRFGAGVKGKIGEAMSHGLPVVTTPIGAEGMGLVHGEQAIVAEPGAELARAVVDLYRDERLWVHLERSGREHIERTLSPEKGRAALRTLLDLSVPTCFLAPIDSADGGEVGAALRSYVAAFDQADPVTLVVAASSGAPTVEELYERLAAELDAVGRDPEDIPDVAVMPCEGSPPLPNDARLVGPGGTIDAAAPPEQWRAAAAEALPVAPDTRPRASIILCCYGNADYTERCLESLERALGARLGREFELVLVDNGSRDRTRELFMGWADRAQLVLLDENVWLAGGMNAGAEAASGRVLVFLNNDLELSSGAIEALVEEASRPGVGAVGARLLYPDGRLQHGGSGWRRTSAGGHVPFHMFHYEEGDLPQARAAYDATSVTGAVLAVPADLFDVVGGFDEGYILGWEDADLCMKLRAAGTRVRYRGDVEIVHHEGVTTGGSYDRGDNVERFTSRWGSALGDDGSLLAKTFGAVFSPLVDHGPPADAADGASLRIVGPVGGLGPTGAEARGLLSALADAGIDLSARTLVPSWIGPALTVEEWDRVLAAHRRPARPDATWIQVGGRMPPLAMEGELHLDGQPVWRLAAVPLERPDNCIAWAASPALADELVEAGWPADTVMYVPPLGIAAERGPGGRGTLALLPVHDAAAAAVLLDVLADADAGDGELRIVPSARTGELERQIGERLPHATVLLPATGERGLAELAGESDVVVALDGDDSFDRQALTAAASGAAVVVARGGVAAGLLGDLAATADRYDRESVAVALADAARRGRRAARAERVASICGELPEAVATMVGEARGRRAAEAAHHAGIEAFESGDLAAARDLLDRALELAPSPEILNDLAVICHARGELSRARTLLEQCLRLAPGNPDALTNLSALSAADEQPAAV